MALAYRAHFALIRSPIFNSKGMNTSAVFGFTATLIDLIQKGAPTHLAIAFDTSAPTERHRLHPEYKANREAMPEDLSIALPYIESIAKGFNIPILKLDGYEADDIIGTIAKVQSETALIQSIWSLQTKILVNSSAKKFICTVHQEGGWCWDLGHSRDFRKVGHSKYAASHRHARTLWR